MGKLAASILSADFAYLADQVKLVEAHADFIHIDVMDAHFVPPLSIGPVVVESLRPVTGLSFHCHLMVEHPIALFDDLKAAGTDIVTAHVESADDPAEAIREAQTRGMRAGLALNPETPVDQVFPHLDELDRVIVMTLFRTGWAGQPFNDGMLPKIETARKEIDRRGLTVDIEVDGGINMDSARRCMDAGATVLAVASSLFKADDPTEAARQLAAVARGS
ncbi:MAG: ribulose-phosphate 3-epimerase [Actinomycetota bacterium]|nr:ribulose-phosphate 3-epimerase [Actinomycetota bacterium]